MSEKELLSNMDNKLDQLASSVETIRRGVYGDKENNVLGLIERQEIDEKERKTMWEAITGIKNMNWKISATFGLTGGGVLSLIIWVFKELMK
jgi:predicted AlkP superfamily phosphohydrolase/phosphomutase